MRDGDESERDGESEPPTQDIDALLVYNVLRTSAALTPHANRGLRELNLTAAQLNALLVLRDSGEVGLPLSEMGRRLVVTRANVTGLADRLEKQGLIWRDVGGDPGDRRVTRARLTAHGAALLEEALPRRRQILAELLSELSPEEKELMIGLMTRLRRGIREGRPAIPEAEACGGGGPPEGEGVV